jgi:UDP-galactopyranose mutase
LAATNLKNKLLEKYSGRDTVNIFELLQNDDQDIQSYGQLLFEKDYRPYSSKQWGIPPENIDESILKRVPIFLSYRKTRFDDKYQCLPSKGFTALVKNMLDHPNITIEKNVNALDRFNFCSAGGIYYKDKKYSGLVIYTGPIDALHNFRFGELPYRSLEIQYEMYNCSSYLTYPAIACPQAIGFVRKTEYTKIPKQNVGNQTVIGIEYPVQYDKNNLNSIGPAYPILNKKNCELHQKYLVECAKFKNLFVCGRLGDFKYYDMDIAMKRALDLVESIFRARNDF